MTPLALLALALAVLLVPGPSPAASRASGLAGAGRLAATAPPTRRARPARLPPRPAATACAVVGAVATLAGGWAFGTLIAVATGIAAATAAGLAVRAVARRRAAVRRREVLAAVRLLAAELAAGSRPADALLGAAEAAPGHALAFTGAAAAVTEGEDVAQLLAGWPQLVPVARAWRVGSAAGVPLAEVLGRVAGDLAAGEQQRREVAAAVAGPRASAALLAGLPVLGVGLGIAMGARPLPLLLGTPAGRLLCCVGVALDAAGVLWTGRLISRAEGG